MYKIHTPQHVLGLVLSRNGGPITVAFIWNPLILEKMSIKYLFYIHKTLGVARGAVGSVSAFQSWVQVTVYVGFHVLILCPLMCLNKTLVWCWCFTCPATYRTRYLYSVSLFLFSLHLSTFSHVSSNTAPLLIPHGVLDMTDHTDTHTHTHADMQSKGLRRMTAVEVKYRWEHGAKTEIASLLQKDEYSNI